MKDIKQFIDESMICELSSELLKRAADKAKEKSQDALSKDEYHKRIGQWARFLGARYTKKKQEEKENAEKARRDAEKKKQEEKENAEKARRDAEEKEWEKFRKTEDGKFYEAIYDSLDKWCSWTPSVGDYTWGRRANKGKGDKIYMATLDTPKEWGYGWEEDGLSHLALFTGKDVDTDKESNQWTPILVLSSKEIVYIRQTTNEKLIKEIMSIVNVPGNKVHVHADDFKHGDKYAVCCEDL